VAGEGGIVSGMAGRYATALFELALESKAVDQVQSDLNAFDAVVVSSPDLTRLVRSPVFAADEQAKALAAVLDRAGIKGIAANFLRIVASNRRLFAVRDMIRAFNARVARKVGMYLFRMLPSLPSSAGVLLKLPLVRRRASR